MRRGDKVEIVAALLFDEWRQDEASRPRPAHVSLCDNAWDLARWNEAGAVCRERAREALDAVTKGAREYDRAMDAEDGRG